MKTTLYNKNLKNFPRENLINSISEALGSEYCFIDRSSQFYCFNTPCRDGDSSHWLIHFIEGSWKKRREYQSGFWSFLTNKDKPLGDVHIAFYHKYDGGGAFTESVIKVDTSKIERKIIENIEVIADENAPCFRDGVYLWADPEFNFFK
jgi:hypothetical protein